MSWLDDKDALKERISNGVAQPGHPSTLPLNEIEVADTVFQHRTNSEFSSDVHVKALLKGLKNTSGKPFDPVTVMWGGDRWVLVDGHHRMRAYQEFGFDAPVPVQVFQGTLEEAFGEALRANVHDKLSMSSKRKLTPHGGLLSVRTCPSTLLRSCPLRPKRRLNTCARCGIR